MTHPSGQELVLHHYREASEPEALDRHLGGCESCRTEFETLGRILSPDALPVPERSDDYGAEVWERLVTRLSRRRRLLLLPPLRGLAFAAVAAAMVVAAYLAGRFWREPTVPVLSAPGRDRILLVAVGDHLDRSERVLIEISNAEPGDALGLSAARKGAEELVADSRLYRQSAARAGEASVVDVLDELERALLEIAHGPASMTATELLSLQRRLEERGVLFKIRILGSQVRDRHTPPLPAAGKGKRA
jgi:hypothetical protein